MSGKQTAKQKDVQSLPFTTKCSNIGEWVNRITLRYRYELSIVCVWAKHSNVQNIAVLTAVLLKAQVFWDVMLCSSVSCFHCFIGLQCLCNISTYLLSDIVAHLRRSVSQLVPCFW
jgi:hypothetical protein